jgi:hypothetical protein
VTFQVGDRRERVGPGARSEVPIGTPHGVYNETDEECHVIGELRPALRTDELMQTVWGLAADGRTNGDGVPNLLQSIAVAREFRDEIELVSPPRAVQRVAIPLLAPLARAFRYSGTYVPQATS